MSSVGRMRRVPVMGGMAGAQWLARRVPVHVQRIVPTVITMRIETSLDFASVHKTGQTVTAQHM